MSWLSSISYSSGAGITNTIIENLAKDDRTWGGNVDAAGYALTNCLGVYGPTGANPVILYTNAIERMRITSAGLVGIGTSIPWAPLTAVAPGYNTVSLTHQSVSTASFAVTASGTELAIFNKGSGSFAISLQTRHSGVDGQTYPICLNPLGGLIGIGLDTPASLLHLKQSANGATNGLRVERSGGTTEFDLYMGGDDNLYIQSNGKYMTIDQSGNIALCKNGGSVSIPLVTYASDAAAGTGGLTAGMLYKDSTGGVHVKL